MKGILSGAKKSSVKKCDVCGKVLDIYDMQSGFELHKTMGWGSVFDGDTVDIKLCLECSDKIIAESNHAKRESEK